MQLQHTREHQGVQLYLHDVPQGCEGLVNGLRLLGLLSARRSLGNSLTPRQVHQMQLACTCGLCASHTEYNDFYLDTAHGSAGNVQLFHLMEQRESLKKLQMGLMPKVLGTQAACCSLRVYRGVCFLDPWHEMKWPLQLDPSVSPVANLPLAT